MVSIVRSLDHLYYTSLGDKECQEERTRERTSTIGKSPRRSGVGMQKASSQPRGDVRNAAHSSEKGTAVARSCGRCAKRYSEIRPGTGSGRSATSTQNSAFERQAVRFGEGHIVRSILPGRVDAQIIGIMRRER